MATVDPQMAMAGSSGITITMIVFSAIGLVVWAISIGSLFGWGYTSYPVWVWVGACVSIADNAGMIYVACRLIFLVRKTNITSAASLQELRQCVSCMVALTVIGFTTWMTSIVWLASSNWNVYYTYHGCNYGFIFSAVVAGLAGGLLNQVRARTATTTGPVHAASPIVLQPPQTQYNQPLEEQRL